MSEAFKRDQKTLRIFINQMNEKNGGLMKEFGCK